MDRKIYIKEWSQKNKEKLKSYYSSYYQQNQERIKERVKKYTQENKEKKALSDKKYAQENKEKIRAYKKVYCEKNKEEINKKRSTFLKNNLNAKLASYLRRRLIKAIKNKYKSGSAVADLGCTINELKQYLELLFQPGMTWENYGKWHIDHILPLSKFDLCDRKQFLKVCHYTNLQPLWAIENWKKGDTYV